MSRANSYATEKRAKILNYIQSHSEDGVSVKDIELYMNETLGLSINITTIYRYLDKLQEQGLVLKHVDEDGKTSSYQYIEPDKNCGSHLHLKCSNCGQIKHLDCEFMNSFKNHIFEHHKFMIECKSSMIYGLCDKCNAN